MKRNPKPIHWRRSDRMVAAYISQIGGWATSAASALFLADQAFPGAIPRGILVAAFVVLFLAGGGVAVSGRGEAKRRIACGADPERPESPIVGGLKAARKEAPVIRSVVLAALLAALTLTSCASTQTTGPDAGPPGPPMPSATDQAIVGYVGQGLPILESGFRFGAQLAADSHQTPRCFVLIGFATLAAAGAEWAPTVQATGEWLTEFPLLKIDPTVCKPNGLVPQVTPETEATVRKLCDALVPPLIAVGKWVMGLTGVSCRWQAWAEGFVAEAAALIKTTYHALAYPNEPWVLPKLPLRKCPAEAPPAAAADAAS